MNGHIEAQSNVVLCCLKLADMLSIAGNSKQMYKACKYTLCSTVSELYIIILAKPPY